MTAPTIFIDGDQGTTGLMIHERLRPRSDLRVLTLPEAERKDARRRAEAINACDIAMLCLPDEAARDAVAAIANPRVRVIDASSAHRVHPDWTYGFPEMAPGQAARIAHSTRVSNPGCYPTGAIALLRPLREAGLLPGGYPVTVHAVSGYSGRGRAGVAEHERGEGPAYLAYGLGLSHKHTPEIQHHAGLQERPVFLPAYGAFRQGIVLTIPLQLRLLPAGTDPHRLHACLAEAYADAGGIELLSLEAARGQAQLDPQALNGTNDLRLAVFAHEGHGQVVLAAVFDNLGKGASGAAVQNLDLMLAGRS
ncbi:N-acetyl-gamma-glutamyl-phosphate reductase [Bordetella sp. 2513F-2]